MQSDPFVRLALGVIALSLVALVALQAGWRPGAEDPAAASDRFHVEIVRMGPGNAWLLRFDKATGEAWRIRFPAVGSGWDRLRDADAKREPAGSAAEPAASED